MSDIYDPHFFSLPLFFPFRMCIYCNFHPSFCSFAGLPRPASDDYQYSSDYDNYDNEPIPNEEEETEINYDIKFMKPGKTLVVDKGTTIKLPCNVDKYPRKMKFQVHK